MTGVSTQSKNLTPFEEYQMKEYGNILPERKMSAFGLPNSDFDEQIYAHEQLDKWFDQQIQLLEISEK